MIYETMKHFEGNVAFGNTKTLRRVLGIAFHYFGTKRGSVRLTSKWITGPGWFLDVLLPNLLRDGQG